MGTTRSHSKSKESERLPGVRELRAAGPAAAAPKLDVPVEFAAAIAHDMRGPLTTITTSAELLEQEMQLEDSTHLINVIQRQAKRLQIMVQDLVEFANLEAGEVLLHPAVVDLAELVRTVCGEHQEFQSSHQLVVEIPASPVRIQADRDKVRRMMENLLHNAFKYTPRGCTVLARLRLQGGRQPEAIIAVDDEGPGIPEEAREMVFRPFVRLDNSRGSGQGLGLYIVKSLAEAHGGSAWVEGGEGGGSRFCFALPAPAQAKRG